MYITRLPKNLEFWKTLEFKEIKNKPGISNKNN